MYIVGEPDTFGKIGVKVDEHRKMFNPYEDRSNLPQGVQDELTDKFTPEIIALYDQKKIERDTQFLVDNPLPKILTDQEKEVLRSEVYNITFESNPAFKGVCKWLADKHSLTGTQFKNEVKSFMD